MSDKEGLNLNKIYVCYSNHVARRVVCWSAEEASETAKELTKVDGQPWWWRTCTVAESFESEL